MRGKEHPETKDIVTTGNEESLVLARVTEEWRRKSFADLAERIEAGGLEVGQHVTPSGRAYNVEVQVLWDHIPGGPIRVIVAVDDGRIWRAFKPKSEDFILSPDGTFVGE